MRLEGKVAIITGGGSGQGRATAELMAREGARVVLADIDEAAAAAVADRITDTGGVAVVKRADVSREGDVRSLVESTVSDWGRVDVLFNNAGIPGQRLPVTEMTEEEWDSVIGVNLKSVVYGCKYALPVMEAQGGGAVVNNASINGLVAMRGGHAYTAAKGGVIALSRVLAVTWGPRGVRVNCICPGPVDTPMSSRHVNSEEGRQWYRDNWIIPRMCRADEVANVVTFLASDDASYLNGTVLPVDGGWTAR